LNGKNNDSITFIVQLVITIYYQFIKVLNCWAFET